MFYSNLLSVLLNRKKSNSSYKTPEFISWEYFLTDFWALIFYKNNFVKMIFTLLHSLFVLNFFILYKKRNSNRERGAIEKKKQYRKRSNRAKGAI